MRREAGKETYSWQTDKNYKKISLQKEVYVKRIIAKEVIVVKEETNSVSHSQMER